MNACRPLLGTYVDIRIDDDVAAGANTQANTEALSRAFAAVERVQALMSVFEADSDIARLNRLPPGQTLQVHPWTAEVLALAEEIMLASDGLFDCGVAPRLADWGLLPSDLKAPGASSLRHVQRLSDTSLRVQAPVRIDLGGIAKGFAVDQAVRALQDAGVRSGLVNAGGDLRVFGQTEAAIHLRHPTAPEQLHHAGQLRDGACATSATYFSRREHGGQEVSALVHPHSGQALRTRASFTVVAPTCAVADALTKVLALSGNASHPCFLRYGAHPIILEPQEA